MQPSFPTLCLSDLSIFTAFFGKMASSSNAPTTSEESLHQQQQYGEEKWTASPQKKIKGSQSTWRRKKNIHIYRSIYRSILYLSLYLSLYRSIYRSIALS